VDAPAQPSLRRGLLKRLPLLIVLAAGVWLWKGGGGWFPVQREIVWNLGEDSGSIQELDIQLADATGKLLKRDQRFFHGAHPGQVVESIKLSRGDYPARVFIRRDAGGSEQQLSTTVHVGDDETVVLWLSGSGFR
jgi:hypothetical protein